MMTPAICHVNRCFARPASLRMPGTQAQWLHNDRRATAAHHPNGWLAQGGGLRAEGR